MPRSTRLATALTLLAAAVCTAGPTVTIFNSPYQAGAGGEFDALILGPGLADLPAGSRFPTFCLEKNEYISLGGSYYGQVLTYADLGGVGGGPQDPLDPRTAWLYSKFLAQTLPGYDFSTTSGRLLSAEALQHAIWYIEQEETANQINQLSPGLRSLTWHFVNLSAASEWAQLGTVGNVRVLSLYQDAMHCHRNQDMLCQVVPAPGAILLSALGTILVGLVRRRAVSGPTPS